MITNAGTQGFVLGHRTCAHSFSVCFLHEQATQITSEVRFGSVYSSLNSLLMLAAYAGCDSKNMANYGITMTVTYQRRVTNAVRVTNDNFKVSNHHQYRENKVANWTP